MWQTVIVIVVVAVALAWYGRRLWRTLSGQAPACGCGGEGEGDAAGCASCSSCQGGGPPMDQRPSCCQGK